MITIEAFASWMKENTLLSDSSVYKYSHAVNTISKEMVEKSVIPLELFDMSLLQIDAYLPIILLDAGFKAKNQTGNNMYSNALKQYRMFCVAVSDTSVNEKEIEKSISGFDTLKETERKSIIKSRLGQGVFRQRLLEKYNGSCIMSGISSKKLLIASHIRPWAASNNAERLSEENGLLLAPTYDKLFDYGLITFTNEGNIIISSQLPREDMDKLNLVPRTQYDLKITQKMRNHLEYHRDIIFVK